MFTNKRFKHTPDKQLIINGEKIKWLDEITYLGMIFDKKLTFKKHIKKLVQNPNR